MKEFKNKDDRSPQEKYEGNEHHDEKEENNYPPNNNEFQSHGDKPDTVFIQEKDLKPGPENYSTRTEPSIRKEQMPNLDVEDHSIHRTTLECSKEFSGKYNCNEPCLAIVSSYQDPTLYKDLTPTNISSASTSRPAKGVLSMDATTRNKNGEVKSHHRNWVGMISSTLNGNTNASKMDKGKEQIIYDADDSISSSNRREDGNEKLECNSSRGIDSTVKRARIYDSESEKLVGGKRLKRLSNGNCSFMNWVTTITNGLTRPHDAPLEVFQHPSQHMKGVISPPISDEDRKYIGVSHETRGFRSIFEAMYHPGSNVSNIKIKYVDHLKEIDAFKGTEGEKTGNVACCVLRERLSFLNGVKENISTGPVNIGSYGIAPRENEVLASSKRFNQDVCQVENSPSAAMDSCAELMTQSRQNSLWITRLSPGVSSPQPKSIQCSNCLDLSAQKLQNDSVHKLPYLEEKPQHNSVSHTDSHGSEKIATDNRESKLQLTLSSNYCRRSEPMPSSFGLRLDALKHTKPSKITNEDIGANKICLFCGMSDHSIRECSEVNETRLEQYLKSISLYDSIKKSSCFCILCLELDHWAASCLNASSKRNQVSCKANGFNDVNFKRTAEENYDGAIMLWPEGKKDHHQVLNGSSNVPQRENKAAETDFVVRAKVSGHRDESAAYGTIDIRMNRLEDTTNTENMKMATSCSWKNELKRSEFKPCCSHLPATVMNEPKGIFVAVRKLRLSRMDILRWIKSSPPHYNLGGFFLRLKIGKVEKGFGVTGYHVACINGESCQSSISVWVGSSNYSVTTRFISNQDFDETWHNRLTKTHNRGGCALVLKNG